MESSILRQAQDRLWYVIKQRLAWIKMHERGAPVTAVCQHDGISRKSFYKWWHRYQEAGRDFHVLKGLSRRLHSHPRAVPRATVERVLALRCRTRYGPRRLTYYLAQEGVQEARCLHRILLGLARDIGAPPKPL